MKWETFDKTKLIAEIGDPTKWDARSIWMILSDFQGFGGGLNPASKELPYAIEFVVPTPAGVLRHKTDRKLLPALVIEAKNPKTKRLQLSLPSIPVSFPFGPWKIPELQTEQRVKPVTMGFIDHGCAFAHPQFQKGEGSRVQYLWDQSDQVSPPGTYWCNDKVNYGRELVQAKLTQAIKDHGRGAELYRALDYRPTTTRYAHGTHVMDMAAGKRNPLWRVPGALTRTKESDAASRSDIVFVQLPWRPIKDTSGSAFAVQILDGIRYILARSNPKNAVIVNISDGAYAGPHDGSSLVERGIDELVQRYPRLTVVIAAGNAYESKLHGKKVLGASGGSHEFLWKVLPDDFKESYCEIWVDKEADIEISVTPPGGVRHCVPKGEAHLLKTTGSLIAGVIHCATDRASTKRCILVALAPTRWRGEPARPAAPHGIWGITVTNTSQTDEVEVNAWIERDNPALGDSGPKRQSYFVEKVKGDTIDRSATLNSLGHGDHTIVVGGYRLIDKTLARYTSAGRGVKIPLLLTSPSFAAPSDQSATLFGFRAAGTTPSATNRMDGTSVAAPIVARKLANQVSIKGANFANVADAIGSISRASKRPISQDADRWGDSMLDV